MPKLSDSVQYLKGVGPKRAALLKDIGVETIGDALLFFPRKYIDRGNVVPIAKVTAGREVAVRGRIIDMRSPRWGDRLEAMIEDGTGTMRIIWFHARFLVKALQTGGEYLFYGRVGEYKRHAPAPAPEVRADARARGGRRPTTDRILVEYPTTRGPPAGLARPRWPPRPCAWACRW